MLRSKLTALLTITAAVAFTAPAVAAAASPATAPCNSTTPGVTVGVTSPADPTAVITGQPVAYDYSFCYLSAGDYYTTQVVSVSTDANGNEVDTAMTPQATYPLAGQSGETTGTGSYTPSSPGRYKIVVNYFKQGQTAWEDHAEVIFKVIAPAVVTPPVVTPPVVTPPVVTPPVVTPPVVTPTPIPAGTPVPATPAPTRKPAGTPKPLTAKIALSKRAVRTVLNAGQAAAFVLNVKDVSKIAARNVTVCDDVPAGLLYLSASRPVSFTGSAACFKLGTLAAGHSDSITIRFTVLSHGGRILNHAIATASNATSVKAQAGITIRPAAPSTVPAPVTG